MSEHINIPQALGKGTLRVTHPGYNRREIWKKCQRGWNKLTGRERQVAELHAARGLTLNSVALALKLAPGTAKAYWYRIRTKIL